MSNAILKDSILVTTPSNFVYMNCDKTFKNKENNIGDSFPLANTAPLWEENREYNICGQHGSVLENKACC